MKLCGCVCYLCLILVFYLCCAAEVDAVNVWSFEFKRRSVLYVLYFFIVFGLSCFLVYL